jgi:RNA polymerase sigma-70 factor (ECF subfamily)
MESAPCRNPQGDSSPFGDNNGRGRPLTETAGVQEPPQSQFPNDLSLAQAVLRRDRKATAELIGKYSDPLARYLQSRLLPRTDLVDDFLQETLLAAWQGLPGYRGQAPLKTWLLGIARHKVEDYYRARLRDLADQFSGEEDVADEPLFDLRLDRERAAAWTWETIGELPEIYGLVLRWRYWEQRSAQEMAASTGRSEKAVERLLSRARDQFRARWLEREGRRHER